ncbi:MAG: PEP-CTERM sorting domain-containing protein [Chitinophagaceae bacterium]|nr:PEP-CTERM sorting domain-containing protein [Rubrivivax sp.]
MKTLLSQALRPLAALTLAAAACAPVSAVTLPFNASYSGVANVVEVIDETVPVLRFRTFASGSGSFDLGSYFSTDVIDMSTGAGAGFNIFTAGNGDELHGSFAVQVVPTAVANIVELIGQATFIGGTGRFSGASGSALFSGTGVFTSATSAVASLTYDGQIALVPEPGTWLLLSAGMAAFVLRRARRAPQ